jgi:hypothetical protein
MRDSMSKVILAGLFVIPSIVIGFLVGHSLGVNDTELRHLRGALMTDSRIYKAASRGDTNAVLGIILLRMKSELERHERLKKNLLVGGIRGKDSTELSNDRNLPWVKDIVAKNVTNFIVVDPKNPAKALE